jgi:predicted transposase YbfD/YdcC
MPDHPRKPLLEVFSNLEDPRQEKKCRHVLIDVVMIGIIGLLCGANDFIGIETFGRAKEQWLRGFLTLEHGIPSHDTFGRMFSLLSPMAFQRCFREWIDGIRTLFDQEIVAVDGKTLRRSHNRKAKLGALHMVSAWAAQNGLVLGQCATDAKFNEITAIPRLLEMLMIKGCIVTIDAMGCQKKIAQQIIGQGGDYVLALKGNQERLAEEVEEAFIQADLAGYEGVRMDCYETDERSHGRGERRRHWVLGDLSSVSQAALWAGLSMIGMVESQRECNGKTTLEYRFSIGSIAPDAKQFARAVRQHWSVENRLHWRLDLVFREDESRLRDPNARENCALLRHMALGLLAKDTKTKIGTMNKRPRGGWDEQCLSNLLFPKAA